MAEMRRYTGERCDGCVFWAQTNFYGKGECRRHAPVDIRPAKPPMPRGWQEDGAEWPLTGPWDWCGDFRADPQPEDAP